MALVLTGPRRLNWGCGAVTPAGWINSDRRVRPGVSLCCDIRDGLAVRDASLDYVVSIHALQDLPHREVLPALGELRRVLRPGGVLRLGLPDLDRAIAAYRKGDRGYFLVPDSEVRSLGGKLAVQMLWYGALRSMYTPEFAEELCERAGFTAVGRCQFGQTRSRYPEIVLLDNRPGESLFVEAERPGRRERSRATRGVRATQETGATTMKRRAAGPRAGRSAKARPA